MRLKKTQPQKIQKIKTLSINNERNKFYMAVINYNFEEMDVLYANNPNQMYDFLIKCAKRKHAFKT